MSVTAIYLRVSLDRDATKVSVDYQREHLHKLCRERGWHDPTEYLDRNVSATTGHRRAYEQLCADIEAGTVTRVAVWDMDRLHRQPRELEDFIELADKHGVMLANVGGDVDLSTPSGRMFARVKGSVARYDVEQMSARRKAANVKRAERGTAWQPRVFGYDGDTVVPHEADAIRTATRDVLNGATLWSIAQQWDAMGLTTVKGYGWTGGQVKQVLIRPRNAGLQVYNVKAARKEGGTGVIEGVETSWPAIVPRETWEALCKLLADPQRFTGKSPGRKYLLTGIALCGICDRTIGTTARKTKRGNNRPVYQCKHKGCMRIVRDLALSDKRVVDAVTGRLARPDAAAVLGRPTVDAAALRDQINTYRAQIAQTEADYDDGEITAQRMNTRIAKITAKMSPLEDKLLGAHMSADVKRLAGQANAAELFDRLPLDRQRGIIETLATVTIHTQKLGGVFDPAAITVDFK